MGILKGILMGALAFYMFYFLVGCSYLQVVKNDPLILRKPICAAMESACVETPDEDVCRDMQAYCTLADFGHAQLKALKELKKKKEAVNEE